MNYTITFTRGETFRLQVQYKNPDGTTVDITNWTVTWKIAVGNVNYTKTTSPEVVVSNAAGGIIDLLLRTSDVNALPATLTGSYTLTATNPGVSAGQGDYELLEGMVLVNA